MSSILERRTRRAVELAAVLLLLSACGGTDEILARERPKSWSPFGEPLSAIFVTSPEQPALALDIDDNPVLAWSQRSAVGEPEYIHVWRWSGTGWHALGAALSALPDQTGANSPAVAVDQNGSVVVAWEEWEETGFGIYAARFSGGRWFYLGAGPLPNSVTAGRMLETYDPREQIKPHAYDSGPALVIEQNGTPVVAFSESTRAEGGAVHVARWSAGTWQSEVIDQSRTWLPPALALADDGTLWVGWTTPDGEAQVVSNSGAGWSPVQSLSIAAAADGQPTTAGYWPSLVVHSGAPVMAWEYGPKGPPSGDALQSSVAAVRWTADGAIYMDRSIGLSPVFQSHTRLAARDQTLALMWYERDAALSGSAASARVHRWRSGRWWPVGGPLSALLKPNSNGGPALCVDRTGRLVVAYKGAGPSGEGMHVVREQP